MPQADQLSRLEAGRVEFATTHWSAVLTAAGSNSPEAAEALEQLCRAYWYPLYAYVRRSGREPHDAQDLTQEFFARLLEKRDLTRVGREKGRFRSFLLVALNHFLANEWHRGRRQKRGGGRALIPLDDVLAENSYHREPAHTLTAEKIYQRRWALTLLEQVLGRLRQEHSAAGKQTVFEELKIYLSSAKGPLTYARVGEQLGLSEGAVKVAVHRLRQRYLVLLREEIGRTVATPGEVEDELRYLLETLTE